VACHFAFRVRQARGQGCVLVRDPPIQRGKLGRLQATPIKVVPRTFGVTSHAGFLSGRLISSNEGTWVLFHHDSSAAPQTASPVCGTKNFVSVRLYSAPQLHRTIVAILGICPRGTPDQPQNLCDHTPLGGVVRLEGRSRTKRPRLAGCKGRGRWRRACSRWCGHLSHP
jgi:hypothetical protein